ncbi:MAG: hypothetical protein RL557_1031 [archaeon]|jgi:hypothetical protein
MAKKKSRNVSRKKNNFTLLNIVLFIFLVLAVVWIFSFYSSQKYSRNLKGELASGSLWGVDATISSSCTRQEECGAVFVYEGLSGRWTYPSCLRCEGNYIPGFVEGTCVAAGKGAVCKANEPYAFCQGNVLRSIEADYYCDANQGCTGFEFPDLNDYESEDCSPGVCVDQHSAEDDGFFGCYSSGSCAECGSDSHCPSGKVCVACRCETPDSGL